MIERKYEELENVEINFKGCLISEEDVIYKIDRQDSTITEYYIDGVFRSKSNGDIYLLLYEMNTIDYASKSTDILVKAKLLNLSSENSKIKNGEKSDWFVGDNAFDDALDELFV